jgi:nucleosome binding factor SPN SPT16 subunit
MTSSTCAPMDRGTILAGKRRTFTVRFYRENGGASLAGGTVTITRTRTGDTDEVIAGDTVATADVVTTTFTVVFADTEQAGPSVVTVDVDVVEIHFTVQARTTT